MKLNDERNRQEIEIMSLKEQLNQTGGALSSKIHELNDQLDL